VRAPGSPYVVLTHRTGKLPEHVLQGATMRDHREDLVVPNVTDTSSKQFEASDTQLAASLKQ
jgi:hypothetical protein